MVMDRREMGDSVSDKEDVKSVPSTETVIFEKEWKFVNICINSTKIAESAKFEQTWQWTTPNIYHKNLGQIGPVVSEKKSFETKVDGRTDDGRRTDDG